MQWVWGKMWVGLWMTLCSIDGKAAIPRIWSQQWRQLHICNEMLVNHAHGKLSAAIGFISCKVCSNHAMYQSPCLYIAHQCTLIWMIYRYADASVEKLWYYNISFCIYHILYPYHIHHIQGEAVPTTGHQCSRRAEGVKPWKFPVCRPRAQTFKVVAPKWWVLLSKENKEMRMKWEWRNQDDPSRFFTPSPSFPCFICSPCSVWMEGWKHQRSESDSHEGLPARWQCLRSKLSKSEQRLHNVETKTRKWFLWTWCWLWFFDVCVKYICINVLFGESG